MVAHNMVTTQFELDGYRVTRSLGVVRGIVVRSRSIFGTIGAGLQTLVGGNITLLTNLCEKTRAEAFDLMLQHASEIGANAVVGARYGTSRYTADDLELGALYWHFVDLVWMFVVPMVYLMNIAR